MWLLALDTTTRSGSVALVRDDDVVVERAGVPNTGHVERLPGDVERVLADAGLAPSAIDVWAVAAGPGGFTGLRVGLATVQGYALALDRPAVGVPTLAALAWWHADRTPDCPVVGAWLDAFRGEVYSAVYATGALDAWPVPTACDVGVGTPAETVERWQATVPAGTIVVGGTGPVFEAALGWGGYAGVPGPEALAGTVGRLALRAHRHGATSPPHALSPVYGRRPDAVVERERRLSGGAKVAPARFSRLADPSEIEGLMALDALCFHRPWTRADYEREMADPERSVIHVAKTDAGVIVAYCSFWRIVDEAHINNFAVHPDWRRQGLGGRLLAYTMTQAAALGAPRATLEVRASNTPALALYRAAGFVPRGTRPAYYSHPIEDALVLWRDASPTAVGGP